MANDRGKGELGRKLAQKALMPVVATVASAAAGYVAKKGPDFFERKVLPKLKEATNGAGGVAESLPTRAKSAVGSVGDLATDLTDRAKDVVGIGSGSGSGSGSQNGDAGRRSDGISQEELQRHIEERAKARAKRRNTSGRS